jgi:2-keto-4-pentenoate hydratase/2-oxohepta-3-ene-1,7-dioic acid hydratase in catechol pathway
MKLATAVVDGQTRLFLETPRGMLDVAQRVPEVAGIADVGALLRAGIHAMASVQALAAGDSSGETLSARDLEWAPPITHPSKIICIGLNYRAHAAEGGDPLPARPIIFAKFSNTLIACGQSVAHPHITESLDYEGELGVVIGQRVTNVAVENAPSAVAGYVVANDVTARDIQSGDPASQWVRGKSLDTFAPMGPYFTTADAVADWRALRLQTWVNGETRQDELCGDMIFGVEELISFVSQDLTLEPGDIILTGTPSGVGAGFTPPRWLHPGDTVEVEISGLGRLTSPVTTAQAQ